MSYSSTILATAGLVSYWRLGESVGTTATDANGANNGTYQNTPTLGATGALADTDTAVTFASATPNQHVLCKSAKILGGSSTFSIEAWVKSTQAPGIAGKPIYCERASSGNDIVKMEIGANGSGQLGLTYRDDAGNVTQKLGTTVMNDGAYHHCVVTVDIGTGAIAFYLDGAATGTGTLTASTNTSITDAGIESRIASDITDPSGPLVGTVDEVAVYTVVLSAATVLDHYTAGITAPPVNPDGAYVRDFGQHTFGPF